MRVSIITVVYNGAENIEDSIRSVIGQTHDDIEYVIIDGGSTDGTLDIIKRYEQNIAKVISEPDNGIYDAMNKGLEVASGDVVGILNSDDLYADRTVIENVVEYFSEKNVDSCYGDLVYVDRHNTNVPVRHWKSGEFLKHRFRNGWMPPHPTFFVKRDVYRKYGFLNIGFPLAADYELMLRFLYKHEVSTTYIPRVLVKMRTGGTSTPGLYTVRAVAENYKAWKVNDLNPNPITFVLKPLSKLLQYVQTKA
ncbi:MAG: glycosyltransferase family 2 protein [Nitrospirota bacterium]|nr:glycosyltransferase family 2 protein [Nitrospirota bacterium]